MKKALLVIDVQNEYFTGGVLPVTYPANSFDHIKEAIKTAIDKGIPVISVQHQSRNPEATSFRRGCDGWQLHKDIINTKFAHQIYKMMPCSFTNTDLEQFLKANGIDTVVIAGYMTQMCCDSTARSAFHRGFKVEFLSDATGTLAFENEAGKVSAEELHRSTLVTQAFMFGKVLSTKEWSADV